MDAIQNPYAPGAGSYPPTLRGRDGELEAFRILLERLRQGRSEKSLLVSGLRGVGKTVLLNEFESIALNADFVTAMSEIIHATNFRALMAGHTQRALREISAGDWKQAHIQRALGVLKAFSRLVKGIKVSLPNGPELSFDVEAAQGYGDSGILHEDLTDLFMALGEAASRRKRGVVFLFDEMHLIEKEDLEALIAALHRTSQRSLPLTCIGVGLPQLPSRAVEAKTYAERLFNFREIGNLPHNAAREALCLPVQEKGADFESAAAEDIIRFTEGYPYFLQEYGRQVWNKSKGPTITTADAHAVRQSVLDQLDESFFRVRILRCTDAEIEYLQAMESIGSGPYRSGDIALAMGRKGSAGVASTRANLIEKGLIYSAAWGQNDFTVPHFADFLRRNYPRGE